MSLKSVCKIDGADNGYFVHFPNPGYAEFFKRRVLPRLSKHGLAAEITISEPVETDSQAFMRLFHLLRDKFASHHNEKRTEMEENLIRQFGIKEGIKLRLKADYGGRDEGKELKSLTKYTRGEWITLIRGVLTEAWEQGINAESINVEFNGRIG